MFDYAWPGEAKGVSTLAETGQSHPAILLKKK
jgi:hypothetical protein